MHLKDLQKRVAEQTGMRESDVAKVLSSVLDTINTAVYEQKESVKIAGFGKFELVSVKERKGHNVQTGESIMIPAHERMKFAASKSVAKGFSQG